MGLFLVCRPETLNLLHVSSCEMFTFCDVLHGAKPKNENGYEMDIIIKTSAKYGE